MIQKINKNRKEFVLLAVVIFQIFLLVNLSSAHSYLIHQTDPLIEEIKIEEKSDVESLINSGINLLIGFLSIKQIGIVSAQDLGCCLGTCDGVEDSEECEGDFVPTECEATSSCQIGTCVDETSGCAAGSPKSKCKEGWDERTINEVPDCDLGCCILNNGASKQFLRKINCMKEGGIFDGSVSETNCKIYTQEMGACILEEGNCQFVTEKTCESLRGNFRIRSLCSNIGLETNCNMPSGSEVRTTCYDDKVYFLDTCGELANVYDSSKIDNQAYWDFVQDPSLNCMSGDNINSPTCGNCDGINSICAPASETEADPTYGNYACKDLECKDEDDNNRIRQNQESWCVYESYVGGSRDVVGSEHRIRWCDKGEIKTKLCENKRGKICGEKTFELGGGDVSMARCRFNEGWKGFALEFVPYEYDEEDYDIINQEEVDEYIDKCEDLSDSRIQPIDLYDTDGHGTGTAKGPDLFKFDFCVPKYPPGLDFWDARSNAESICEVATITCTTVWRKRFWFKYRCKGNCDCLNQKFANQMNDFCISLGDCGGYVNVEEKYTKNFKTFDINSLSSRYRAGSYDAEGDISESKKSDYKSYANQIGEGDLPQYFSSSEEGFLGGDPFEIEGFDEEDFDMKKIMIFLGVIGGVITTGATITIISILAKYSSGITAGPLGWVLAAVALVAFALMILLAIFTEYKEVDVTFECKPWQAPIGGDDCEKCNENPLSPCTEYKCMSLGSGCGLIGEEELYEVENPVCFYAHRDDSTPPTIVFEEIDEENYDYNIQTSGERETGVEIISFDGECIQEFSLLNFTLKTIDEDGKDDEAKCVYNWASGTDFPSPGNDYSLIGNEFKEGGFFSVMHTFEQRLPYVSSLSSIRGNLGRREGDLIMHVRCMDYAGNPNINEYLINLCIKEGEDNEIAVINEYFPEDGSFLKYGNTTQVLRISLNEPADCRWAHDIDQPYDNMENFTNCDGYLDYEVKSEWNCYTTLTNLTELENNIYIKCKDQPWIKEEIHDCDDVLPENLEDCLNALDDEGDSPWTQENRNVNTKDFPYTLHATESPLTITSISPQGEVIGGGDIFKIDLEVTTSGGMDNGISTCEYEFIESPSDITSWDFFLETYSTYHKQPFSPPNGHYNILVTCIDDVGNKVEANAVFDLIVDRDPPIIVRIYKDGSQLKLITNEEAKCYYDVNRCFFDFTSENSMTTAFSTEHTVTWNPEITYHVKCKDIWGKENSDCAIKIIPSS